MKGLQLMLHAPSGLRVVLYYVVLATLWVLFSDQLIEYLAPNKSVLTFLQTIKGITFIFVTAGLLYFYLNKILNRLGKESESLAKVEGHFREEQILLKRITDTSPISIVVVDKNGKITFANPHSLRLFDYNKDDISELDYKNLSLKIMNMQGLPLPEGQRPFYIVKRQKQPIYNHREIVQTSKGKIIYLSVNAAPLLDNDGEFEGMITAMVDVTEQVKSEEKFKQAQITYRGILDSINEGVFVQNKSQKFFYVNRSMQLMFGHSYKDLIGKSYEVLAAPEKNDLPRMQQIFENIFNGEIEKFEFWGRTKEGVVFPAEVNLTSGNYFGMDVIVGVLREITDRKRYEEQLKAGEERYRLMFKKNPLPMMVYDVSTLKFLNVNNATIDKYGYTHEEFLEMTIKDIRPDEEVEKLAEELKANKSGIHNAGIWKHKTKSGKIILVEISSHEIILNNKRARIVLANDVTDKIKAQEEREQFSQRLNHYLYTSPSAIFSLTFEEGEAKPVWVSESVKSILGYNPSEVLNIEWWEKNVYPDDKEDALKQITRALDFNTSAREYRFYRKDGRLIWLHDELRLLKDENGRPKEIVGTWTDITKQKEIEIELRDSELKFRSIFENIQDVYFETSMDGKIIEISPSIFVLSKGAYKREDIINKYMHNYQFGKNSRDQFLHRLNKEERVTDYEMHLKLIGDKSIPCSMTAKLIYANNDEPKIVGTLRDISQRKENEAALIKAKEAAENADKLKSEFLAQMSHEIRTPINVVLNATSVIEDQLKKHADGDVKEMFPIAKSAGARIMRTIDSILNMSEIQSGTYQPKIQQIDLYKDIISNLCNEFKYYAKQNKLELICEMNSKNPVVNADEYSVSQIFSNLIDNAIKYTPEGTIRISVNDIQDSKVKVSVSDTGIGIKDEYIPHLFEPFTQEEQGYTRKFEGNGLGLALVQHYCEINNAQITVESKIKLGSTFSVVFDLVK